MNQLCKVCGEPAAGFHFGAFTCEGCKSFFGRTYNNISAIAGCKNSGDCVINKKNRTACKACRLRKCLLVGMSKSGSRYGRRSNWFKIHCLLQEQQTQSTIVGGASGGGTNIEQLARLHQMQARQTYQDKTNPCIKTASISPTLRADLSAATTTTTNSHRNNNLTPTPAEQHMHYLAAAAGAYKSESRLSDTPSDSGASSAGDAIDERTKSRLKTNCQFASHEESNVTITRDDAEQRHRRRKQFLEIFRSHSKPMHSPFAPFAIALTHLHPPPEAPHLSHMLPANAVKEQTKRVSEATSTAASLVMQDEPIDLSLKTRLNSQTSHSHTLSPAPQFSDGEETAEAVPEDHLLNVIQKPAPLDLTLVRSKSLTG